MNVLICLVFVGAVSAAALPVAHQIPDTADVAAAKARFFQLYAEQAALAAAAPDDDGHLHQDFTAQNTFSSSALPVQQQFSGHQAIVNSEGFVQNTAEVQNAINEFNAAYAAQLAATRSSQSTSFQHQIAPAQQAAPIPQAAPVHQQASFNQQYIGPFATFNADGSVQNTAEVKAAAKAFFEAYQYQLATANAQSVSAPQQFVAEPIQQAAFTDQRWTGPYASTVPAGVEGALSHVIDTSEVQAAEQEFFRAYQAQLAATASSQASPTVYQAVNTQAVNTQVVQSPQPAFRAAAVHNQQQPISNQFEASDVAQARSAHHQAFLNAIETTGDTSPEAVAAKAELFNAYRDILQLIS